MAAATTIGGIAGCHFPIVPAGPSHGRETRPVTGQAQETGKFQYVNVAARAGLTFRHDDCRKGTATMMEQAGPGCAIIDYDGDGWPDLYLVNGRDLYGRGWKRKNAL